MKYILVFCLLSFLSFGCATVESSNAGGHHLVSIKNTGWKLFNVIPIASGNVNFPNTYTTRLFSDSTDLENNIAMLDDVVKKNGARGFRNISSSIHEENVLFILFSRRIYHTSAELVFDSSHAE